jgi:DNA-binding protein YbaB
MKDYKNILKDIKKAGEAIEKMQNDVNKLDFTEERRQAAKNGGYFNNKGYKELYDAAQDNADAISKIYKEIYNKEIERRILKANARAALLAEAMPIILKAFEKYDGKPYGEKTREKIREEVKSAGYGFYITGYENYKIVIYTLTNEGYKSHADEATGAAHDEAGHIQSIITNDNKINIKNVIIKSCDNYTEDAKKAAAKTADAIRAYSDAVKNLKKQRRELCELLPAGLPTPDYIKDYSITF